MVEIVMTFSRWKKDERGAIAKGSYPQYAQIRGHSVRGINAEVQALREGNELDKYTPWDFVRVDELEAL